MILYVDTGPDLVSIRAGSSEAVKLLQDVVLLLNTDNRAEVRQEKVYEMSRKQSTHSLPHLIISDLQINIM